MAAPGWQNWGVGTSPLSLPPPPPRGPATKHCIYAGPYFSCWIWYCVVDNEKCLQELKKYILLFNRNEIRKGDFQDSDMYLKFERLVSLWRRAYILSDEGPTFSLTKGLHSLWRRAYARNVRLRFLYRHYTPAFQFQFVSCTKLVNKQAISGSYVSGYHS